jgi:hypothetical protein
MRIEWFNQWKQKIREDKPRAVILGLAVVWFFVLLGWGITTWRSLHLDEGKTAAQLPRVVHRDDLSFLDRSDPRAFVIKGNSPFYAPLPPEVPPRPTPPPRYTAPAVLPTPAPAPTRKNIDLVYKGMMLGGEGQPLALVQDKLSGRALFVKVGDSVQGGSVASFTPNVLVWEKAGERIELKLGESRTVGSIQTP